MIKVLLESIPAENAFSGGRWPATFLLCLLIMVRQCSGPSSSSYKNNDPTVRATFHDLI